MFKRLFNTLNAFSGKASKVAGLLVQGGGGTVWTPRRYDSLVKEAYMINVIGFRCIDEIARSVASVQWNVFQREADGNRANVERHPLLEMMRRPNPRDSFSYIMEAATVFFIAAGNTFIERVSPLTGPNKSIPKELYVHRPDRMRIVLNPVTGGIAKYVIQVNGKMTEWEVDPVTQEADVLHMRTVNPLDDWWGMSRVEPLAREIDTSNAATSWNKALLDNQARPGLLMTFQNNVGDDQFEKLEKQLNDKFGGPANASKTLILEGGGGKVDAKPYGFSPAEMDFIKGNQELARRIAFGFGVPPVLIGIQGDSTFNNYREARLAFWENTVIYYLNRYREEFNNWFFEPGDIIFMDYDLDQVPAMEPRREQMWERAQTADFLTINEKREMVGIESVGDEGDVILVPATMIPLGQEVDDDETPGDDEGNEDEENEEGEEEE